MYRRLIVIFLLVFFVVSCSEQEPSFATTTGQTFKFSEFKGKWVFINYWAKWCGVCIKEIPVLNQVYIKNKAKLVVLGVSFDKMPEDELAALVSKLGIKFLVLNENPAYFLNLESVSVVPTTVVIDPQGKIVRRLYGPQTLKALLKIIN